MIAFSFPKTHCTEQKICFWRKKSHGFNSKFNIWLRDISGDVDLRVCCHCTKNTKTKTELATTTMTSQRFAMPGSTRICNHFFVLLSVISPIDGKSMECITSVKIFHGSEFKANGKVIRWTEVQFTEHQEENQAAKEVSRDRTFNRFNLRPMRPQLY